jgi:peptidoglycan/LPS O-acetylase OafA/YrhL
VLKIQRIVSSGSYYPEIDGLRFLAIIAVLLVHIIDETLIRGLHLPMGNISLGPQIEHLSRGVQLFFVISGFILARPFIRDYRDKKEPVSLKKFYVRRVTRLEPPYLISLAIYALALLFSHKMPGLLILKSGLSSAIYTHNLFPYLSPLNFVTWSLEIEIQFYLIVPILALVFTIRKTLYRRLLLTASVILLALYPSHQLTTHSLPSQLAFFLLGLLLAELNVLNQKATQYRWDVFTVIAWLGVFLAPSSSYPLLLLSLGMAFTCSLRAPIARRFLCFRPVALIGGMCYSIYLMHMLIISLLFTLTRHLLRFDKVWENVLIEITVLLPLVLAGSVVYYLAVERPCMDPHWPMALKNKLQRHFLAGWGDSSVKGEPEITLHNRSSPSDP